MLYFEKGKLVGMRGFEPPTTCTPYRCATRLRYIPKQVSDEHLNAGEYT